MKLTNQYCTSTFTSHYVRNDVNEVTTIKREVNFVTKMKHDEHLTRDTALVYNGYRGTFMSPKWRIALLIIISFSLINSLDHSSLIQTNMQSACSNTHNHSQTAAHIIEHTTQLKPHLLEHSRWFRIQHNLYLISPKYLNSNANMSWMFSKTEDYVHISLQVFKHPVA